jgi:NADH:ubiquinone oxidoreductase subunit 6 (subunit J)
LAVLFLFVVMMLNLKLIELYENIVRYIPIGSVLGLLFVLVMYIYLQGLNNPYESLTSLESFTPHW